MTDFSILFSYGGIATVTADHFYVDTDFVVFYIEWCGAVVKIVSFDRDDLYSIRYKKKLVDVRAFDSVGAYFPERS